MSPMMEEEIQMLFRLSMPEDWRNRMPPTPPSSPPTNTVQDENVSPTVTVSPDSTTFWSNVGLRSYAQMDFDLDLSLKNKFSMRGGNIPCKSVSSCGRRKGRKGKGNLAAKVAVEVVEGMMTSEFDPDNWKSNQQVEKVGSEDVDVEATTTPTVDDRTTSCGVLEDDNDADNEFEDGDEIYENDMWEVVPPNALCLINILRLTLDCPFSDVRKQSASVLFLLKEKGVPIPFALINGPCTFIHPSECPSIDVDKFASELGFTEVVGGGGGGGGQSVYFDEDTEFSEGVDENVRAYLELKKARLLSEAFLSSGRVDHTIQLMAYHPDYLEIFLRTHHFLMRGDGPLPYNFRNYIAIMAAARYRSSYLMELQKREFLYQGGDPNWLRGLDCAPPKLTALYNINKVMAHRPWVLRKEDLQHLTKKAGWSLSEVVQAVVILAHFHSLSSFIHGCGITPEVDFDNGHTFLLDPARVGGGDGMQRDQHHGQVSFALDHLEGPSSALASGGDPPGGIQPKQTKSILKKTDPNISSNNLNSPVGINVPNVNFHQNQLYQQNQPFHHHSSPISLNSSPTTTPSLLKSDAIHNSLCGGGGGMMASSPPRGGAVGGSNEGVCSSSVSEVDIIMATMKNLSETHPIEDPEERKKRFETVARSDLDGQDQKENLIQGIPHSSSPSGPCHNPHHHSSMLPPDVSPFISEPEFIYEDFAKRGQISELHTFRIQDYSWEEHGFSLVNRLYAEVGQILDDKFKVAQSMTYYTIGGRANVDTTKFRTAVWNYIQCLYGIRHDDYDYGEVNQLLERPLKSFIKTVCCYPERITKTDYDNVMREFKHSEKVHVNLMIMEAKLQAELLYGLRTVMKLMF